MVFLRSAEDDHDLALAQIPPDFPDLNDPPRYTRPGLEHFSYLVDDIAEMERAVKLLQNRGIKIVRGIGKHGPGENCFLVFKDPDGNNVEIYCEMRPIKAGETYPTTVWERSIESFDRWRFTRFVVPPPAAVDAAKTGK